uniref:Coiled-coil domain-containing protein n=1 Tax=Panagrolaimus sp. ES5 TaxID=591445 RepID=A0AC34GR50_9BILA
MQRRQSDIDRESVKDVASRLRQFEDHNLAIKLQEEEFNHHYNRNRSERQVMGVDTRKSKEEQELEKRYALEKRLAECREIAARDEAIAKQLQQDLEAEERRLKQEQDILDQEIARRMQARYEPPLIIPPPTSTYEEDERLAREMHEKYLRRMRGLATAGSLDERTRGELVQHQTVSPPSSLQPRQSTLPDELGPPTIPATHFSLSPPMSPSTINLPPLPSYTEVCTPTTPVLTNTSAVSSASIRPLSAATSSLLTSTSAAIQPARAPLHEIIPASPSPNTASSPAAASTSVHYSFLTPISPVTNTINPATAVPTTAANINNNFLQNLHPTNPFKESLEAEYRAHNPESPLFRPNNNNPSQSEFGLPPFSDIYHSANSISRDRPTTTTASSTTTSGMPSASMLPMVNVVQEIRTKISNPNNL